MKHKEEASPMTLVPDGISTTSEIVPTPEKEPMKKMTVASASSPTSYTSIHLQNQTFTNNFCQKLKIKFR
jgi:hypothetical protein